MGGQSLEVAKTATNPLFVSAASEAFSGWLHHLYTHIKLYSDGHNVLPCNRPVFFYTAYDKRTLK